MFRFALLFVLAFFTSLSLPAAAASFDCAKAGTPFEHAICDSPELSAADDRLAKTYQTAIGGLSENALAAVRGISGPGSTLRGAPVRPMPSR